MTDAGTALASEQEVIVMLRLKFKPGVLDRVLEELVPAAKLTREEPGNNAFEVYRGKGDENLLVLVERWASQAALDEHFQQDYTKRVLALFDEFLVRPLSETEDVTPLSDVMSVASV